MDDSWFDPVCPYCGQQHAGVERTNDATEFQEKKCGFGVCANCGSIFAADIKDGKLQTHSLSGAQLIKMQSIMPQTYNELVAASKDVMERKRMN